MKFSKTNMCYAFRSISCGLTHVCINLHKILCRGSTKHLGPEKLNLTNQIVFNSSYEDFLESSTESESFHLVINFRSSFTWPVCVARKNVNFPTDTSHGLKRVSTREFPDLTENLVCTYFFNSSTQLSRQEKYCKVALGARIGQ